MTGDQYGSNPISDLVPERSHDWPAARIDGTSRPGGTSHALPDPATGDLHATVGWAQRSDVHDAVEAAVRTRASWAATTGRQRASALRAIATDLRDNAGSLANLITRETGKLQREAAGEVEFSAQYFEWFAEAAAHPMGRHIDTDPKHFMIGFHPVGVVAAVTPWNFPLSIPARKVAAALAAACPVVLKPSELTPLSCLAMVRIVERHVPGGVIGCLVGDGEALTSALVDHHDVSAVSFTGSTRVGVQVAQRAMRTMTRVTMELGGIAPFIVLPDADLEAAAEALMVAKFRNNGASCIAANNVYVHRSIYDPFLETVRQRMSQLRVGPPNDSTTDLGPMLRPAHVTRLDDLTHDAAKVGCPVQTVAAPSDGYFCAPTLIEHPRSARLWEEEVFGPLLAVTGFDDVDDVVDEVNARNSGLAGYVMSRDTERALRIATRIRVGIVAVNNGAPNTPEVPFGGFGAAGIGREGGMEGMLEFLETQTVSVAK